MSAASATPARQLVPFAALSASYFAHIGFFNPYLSLWLKDMGLAVWLIGPIVKSAGFTSLIWVMIATSCITFIVVSMLPSAKNDLP